MKTFRLFCVFVALAVLASACIPVIGDPLARYNGLITSYQNGQEAAANGQSCFALVGQQLALQVQVYNSYLTADVTKAKVYRDALQSAADQINSASQAYVGPDGQPIPANKLDLGALAAAKATPADQATGFTLMVKAFTEAPLAPVDPSVLANTQRIIAEQFNQAQSCVVDWNSAVKQYNIERNQISGDVVGSIAQRLGVKNLPESLPYFTPPAGSLNPFNISLPTPVLPSK